MGRIVEVLFFSNNTTKISAIVFDYSFSSKRVGSSILLCIHSNNFLSAVTIFSLLIPPLLELY